MSEPHRVKISEVMTTEVIYIDPMATVREAVDLMAEHRTSSLVVKRRDPNDDYGMIMVRDIARDVVGRNLSPDRVNVYEVMTKPVLCLPGGSSVENGVNILTRFRLARAMVVDDSRKPLGVVTLSDMVIRGFTIEKEREEKT